jgi:hypothetical protein
VLAGEKGGVSVIDHIIIFVHVVDSMFNQHAKWLKVTRNEIPWRRPIASLNYLLSSHVWRQDHNGFSHQDPGFIVIRGTASYDGMCRPRQYQAFVFVRGVFAGTLSPAPMDSRTDGALGRVFLRGKDQSTAEYVRYTAEDPACCPSSTTTVVFEIARDGPVLRPVHAYSSSKR